MKISTRGRYGTRALLDLALQERVEPVMLKDIAHRQQISLRYLEQLINPLITAGMVKSTRGPKGGISLARHPEEIKLSDIIEIFEGSIVLVDCVNDPGDCPRSSHCVTRDIWIEIKKSISVVLDSTTLQDLVERQKKKDEPTGAMYYI
ncbi:RrF2 family transcriptional regulator [Chloroflexota bacterium]